ncbi:LLM class flavin-dependent oxidoreductase [Streptomyces sp. NPDC020412]|uniref:LLM class flavin-dependent oxidoreductase n=1 Tax=Streptomyces sp. NPDC020412 TaxID=3365073 RepID=UPI00379D056C
MTVHVGAQLPVNSTPGYRDGLDLAQVARHAEALGLDSVWVGDRLSARFPVLDSSLVLATAAAGTERITVGYGVLLLGLRPAVWAAKQIATLQHLSRGRLALGVGVGSGDPQEWAAVGASPGDRGRRTEEALRLLPGLLAGEPTELTELPDRPLVTLSPAAPMPEVWIGGGADAALRRAVAHGQGWQAAMKTPEQLASAGARLADLAAERGVPTPRIGVNVLLRMTGHAAEATAAAEVVAARMNATYGVDRAAALEIGVAGSPAQVAERLRAYADAGAEKFVLVPCGAEDDDPFRQYELFAEVRELLSAE